MTSVAYIGLGANLGERARSLRAAVERLRALAREEVQVSPLYEARGLGPPQPDYLNAVVRLATDLDPPALLAELQRIEHELGRVRTERWGPRTIDLDLLLVVKGGISLSVASPQLVLPHPGLRERDFVLAPLRDLDPELEVAPGVTVSGALAALPASARTILRRLERAVLASPRAGG